MNKIKISFSSNTYPKVLLGLTMLASVLFASNLGIEVKTVEVELQKKELYLKVNLDEFNAIMKERTNKVYFINSKKIKDNKFHMVEYLDIGKNVVAETIETSSNIGVDFEQFKKLILEKNN